MPIYEYETTAEGCEHCRERFEVVQTFSEAALEACPECGGTIAKVFSTAAVQGAGRSAETLSNKGLAEKGFTKYVKAGGGHYEKVAGKGPNVIKR
jgi:putative FmdB family regulatory protein